MGRRIYFLMFAAFLACAASALVVTQKSSMGGVVVAVTAGNLAPEATVWDFAIVMRSSRGRELTDDLLTSAVLVDPQGREYKALIWENGAAEPYHRAGVLKFIAIDPRPDSVELRIARPGEARPRSFSWLLGSGLVAAR